MIGLYIDVLLEQKGFRPEGRAVAPILIPALAPDYAAAHSEYKAFRHGRSSLWGR
jgi:hypothetical protein